MTKNARQLAVGDKVYLTAQSYFLIEKLEPSPTTGWGAPVLIGTYYGGQRHGMQGSIDTGSNPLLTDHQFEIL